MEIKDIKDPKFLKDMSVEDLKLLSIDMRKYILDSVSKTGGHLSSNLGIVDLTIAMLKVFDIDKDKFLFDVGHECYPYKILTGRAKDFDKLRKKDGLSGFQSMKESKYDHFEAGHSSTSLSTATGMAIARDLDKKNYNIISIVGDGSFSNGLCFEALNQIGSIPNKQIIILNDNDMSISENVGALHNMLDKIRSSKKYEKTKASTKNALKKTKFGMFIYKIIDGIKSAFKKLYLRKGSMFTDLGIEYYGPINGHDYVELLKYLEIAKNENKSVILHVITEKGKGYPLAEEDKLGKFHGIVAFNKDTGEVINTSNPTNLPSFSEIIATDVYNYAKKDDSIICITPGMTYGSKLLTIKDKLPKQFIDVGIAEEHALLVANGLALSGKKPFVFIYSTFLQRGYDEIVHDIARMNSNVTFMIDRSGFVPSDGVSHQGVFDIPMMMSVPNMIITSPKDAREADDMIYTSLSTKGPFAIRFPKKNIKYDYNKARKLPIGSWETLSEGLDLFIITYGDFVNIASSVMDRLNDENIHINVVNARFQKPIDTKLFNAILKTNKPIIIYEESTKLGSLASVLCEVVEETDYNGKITIMGLNDEYQCTASREELIKLNNLDEESLYNKVKEILK